MSCVFWGQRHLRLEPVFHFPVHGLRASATAGWMSCGVPWRELGVHRARGVSTMLTARSWRELRLVLVTRSVFALRELRLEPVFSLFFLSMDSAPAPQRDG